MFYFFKIDFQKSSLKFNFDYIFKSLNTGFDSQFGFLYESLYVVDFLFS